MAPFGTLYTLTDTVHPRSRKILAAAALNDLTLTLPAAFENGVSNKTPDFLSKFPLGQIPTFESAEEPPLYLSESTAIAQHVAASGPRRDQLLGGDARARALNQQWIQFNDLTFERTAADLARWRLGYAAYDAAHEAQAAADVRRWLARYEGHLAAGRRTWLVNADDAGGPSLADLVFGGTLFILRFTYMDAAMRDEYPHVRRFYEGLQGVPGLAELYTGPLLEKRKEFEEQS
ncbi:Glutathione S-transferase-like protein FUS3 [Apiospora kogelbergensis]|uniref:Glutathione S-transferase-like protein FUS3 n=1 Tax=Apiospora kogelbergensis TaxID=1337665 RepID=UPI00312D6C13